jgi:LPXTG-motif cell wall-anchored protein
MLMDVPPGAHTIHLRFEVPLENRVGQVVFGITLLVLAALVFWRRRASAA